ncbi:hypothetical protein HN803_03530 [candidate division WWE3 bacterium]|mgnify:FL=1|nr:hypothetical protein [candidate division WWE3 bacterium]
MQVSQMYKAEMYDLIERWDSSGLTQKNFCLQEGVSVSTFGYWRKRYIEYRQESFHCSNTDHKRFLSVEQIPAEQSEGYGKISIRYPNGVELSCPDGMTLNQLRTLINL